MPEYSSTTITPADSVKVPAMNGSSSGNFQLDALRNFILASKGQANGLASLDANGKLTAAQLPDLADDVLVYANYATFPASGTAGKLYIAADTNKIYRWDDSLGTPAYVYLKVDWTDLTDGTVTVKKAECDASGNTITSTYETKADANDLKNAITDSEQRIENLEQAVSGSLVQTNVLTDPPSMANVRTITNANTILPWALLNRVGARAVAWNQLVPIAGSSMSDSVNGIILTDNRDGSYRINGTASSDATLVIAYVTIPRRGHYNLIAFNPSANVSNVYFGVAGYGIDQPSTFLFHQNDSTDWTSTIRVLVQNGVNLDITIRPIITDITAMGEYNSSLTDAQNIANFRAKFPASYYPYNAGGIIPLNPSGFRVIGANIWDEVAERGYYDASGSFISSNAQICSKNLIPVIPNKTYYFLCPSAASGRFCYYDSNGTFINRSDLVAYLANNPFTVPSGCFFIKWHIDYANAYSGGIQICDNALPDAVKTTYHPHSDTTLDTSFTSDYKYVNPSCHDYSENVLVDGQKMREEHKVVDSVVFDGSDDEGWTNFAEVGTIGNHRGACTLVNGQDRAFAPLCSGVRGMSYNEATYDENDNILFFGNGNNNVFIVVGSSITTLSAFKNFLQNNPVTVYFAKATPNAPTLHDPIPNFPCEDGTTITAITPQTELVNAIDVPTTIAYMTKISS